MNDCPICQEDAAYLRSSRRPAWEALEQRLTVVDLFAGCGGLTLGVMEAARAFNVGVDIRLAVDWDETPLDVYKANFPMASTLATPVESVLDGELDSEPTVMETELRARVGTVDILVAGPPCQGHSDLNNSTRRSDPRNLLYLRVARAAQVLNPKVLMIENVPTVTHDVAQASESAQRTLQEAGYSVAQGVVHLARLGVPQRRKRHVVIAVRGINLEPASILYALPDRCTVHSLRSVRWAIEDLGGRATSDMFDSASRLSDANKRRIQWVFEHDEYDLPNRLRPLCHQSEHSYRSMYGRLRWDSPAQTVTTGFGSPGQGRYVHPAEERTITPHEAARLQFFPDFFSFDAAKTRGALAQMIGNAVPPVLSMAILREILPAVLGLTRQKNCVPQTNATIARSL